MKIGVVSDTHSKEIPKQMLNDFQGVDFIIHAGDVCDITNYNVLAKIKDVKAVYGNMDDSYISQHFPRRQILKCGNFNIGLVHGDGPPDTILKKVQAEFKNDKVDVVIFGHSHQPLNEKIGNVLYFNPGSPNDDVFAPYCSYGILEVSGKRIAGKIIKVKT